MRILDNSGDLVTTEIRTKLKLFDYLPDANELPTTKKDMTASKKDMTTSMSPYQATASNAQANRNDTITFYKKLDKWSWIKNQIQLAPELIAESKKRAEISKKKAEISKEKAEIRELREKYPLTPNQESSLQGFKGFRR